MREPLTPAVPALGIEPSDVASLPAESMPGLLAGLAALQAAVAARLVATPTPSLDGGRPEPGDGLVGVERAARLSGMSRRWLYQNGPRLGIARRIGRSVRFDLRRVQRWLATRDRGSTL